MALIVMIGMVASFGAIASAADSATVGPVVISLTEVNDEGASFLSFAMADATGKLAIAFDGLMFEVDGITRVRQTNPNDDIVGVGGAGVESPTEFVYGGFANAGVEAGGVLAIARVDGEGTIAIKGNIKLEVDGEDSLDIPVDITLSNAPKSPTPVPTPTDPTPVPPPPPAPAPAPTPSEPVPAPEGPPSGGVALAIIPTLVAAGAAIVASRKRK